MRIDKKVIAAINDLHNYHGHDDVEIARDKRLKSVAEKMSLYLVRYVAGGWKCLSVDYYDVANGCAEDANFGERSLKDKESLIEELVQEEIEFERELNEVEEIEEIEEAEQNGKQNMYEIKSNAGTEWEDY